MSNFLDNLTKAVRENPLSAALIGGGALWLLIGNYRLKSAAASMSTATASLADSDQPSGLARKNAVSGRRVPAVARHKKPTAGGSPRQRAFVRNTMALSGWSQAPMAR
jgi:hypothetical protein